MRRIKSTLHILLIAVLTIGFSACSENPSQNKAQNEVQTETKAETESSTPVSKSLQLIQDMEKVNGGWNALLNLKDVEYTYTYDDKAKGIDLSTERYIFQDESSWAEYSQHNVNVMPGKEGKVMQSLVDGNPKITMDGNMVTDEAAVGGTAFLRHANFYWFTMMYKLNDPNAVHTYLGNEN